MRGCVPACRRTDIHIVTHRDTKPPPDASRVITPVYASPMEVNVGAMRPYVLEFMSGLRCLYWRMQHEPLLNRIFSVLAN